MQLQDLDNLLSETDKYMVIYSFNELVNIFHNIIPLNRTSMIYESYTDQDDAEFMVEDVENYLTNVMAYYNIKLSIKNEIFNNEFVKLYHISKTKENIPIVFYNDLDTNVFSITKNFSNILTSLD
jgi:hypothetical protein